MIIRFVNEYSFEIKFATGQDKTFANFLTNATSATGPTEQRLVASVTTLITIHQSSNISLAITQNQGRWITGT